MIGYESAEAPQATKHVCGVCGREFDTQHGLTMHRGRAHKKRPRRPRNSRPSFNREAAIRLVVGDSIPVKQLSRIEKWLEEGAAIRKDVVG